MGLLGLIKFLELITAIIGTIYYKKYSQSFLRYFLLLLWLVAGVEFTMWALKNFEIRLQNKIVYNFLTTLQYIYYFLLYYNTIRKKKYKQWVLSFLIVFMVTVGLNFTFIQRLTLTAPFHSYTYIIGAILLVVTIGLFFIEVLNTEKVLYFKSYLMFWISIGLVLFHASVIPFIVSINFLPGLLYSNILLNILFALNFIMFTCFIIGFVISRPYND